MPVISTEPGDVIFTGTGVDVVSVSAVGAGVGSCVGSSVGAGVGSCVGSAVGVDVGSKVDVGVVCSGSFPSVAKANAGSRLTSIKMQTRTAIKRFIIVPPIIIQALKITA